MPTHRTHQLHLCQGGMATHEPPSRAKSRWRPWFRIVEWRAWRVSWNIFSSRRDISAEFWWDYVFYIHLAKKWANSENCKSVESRRICISKFCWLRLICKELGISHKAQIPSIMMGLFPHEKTFRVSLFLKMRRPSDKIRHFRHRGDVYPVRKWRRRGREAGEEGGSYSNLIITSNPDRFHSST